MKNKETPVVDNESLTVARDQIDKAMKFLTSGAKALIASNLPIDMSEIKNVIGYLAITVSMLDDNVEK